MQKCCSTMMLLAFSALIVCLSAYSESTVLSQEPGGSINLTCSFDGCPKNISGYNFLYLYYEFNEQKEVLFYDTEHLSPQLRRNYKERTQINTSTMTFTIRNLTVNDTGLYRCVYKKLANDHVTCSIYAVFITEMAPCPSIPPTINETSTTLMYIILICIISVLANVLAFFLLTIPKVKNWCLKRRVRTAQIVSHDNVYETMTKNPVHQCA